VRTARAVFRGPLTATAKALTDGTISPAHAAVLAHGTQDLPAQVAVEAEPVLVEAAGRLDPPRLRRVLGHLQLAADPEAAEARTERQHGRRGLWLSSTLEGMVAVDGLLDPEVLARTLVGDGALTDRGDGAGSLAWCWSRWWSGWVWSWG
jgi:hypothetical protein